MVDNMLCDRFMTSIANNGLLSKDLEWSDSGIMKF